MDALTYFTGLVLSDRGLRKLKRAEGFPLGLTGKQLYKRIAERSECFREGEMCLPWKKVRQILRMQLPTQRGCLERMFALHSLVLQEDDLVYVEEQEVAAQWEEDEGDGLTYCDLHQAEPNDVSWMSLLEFNVFKSDAMPFAKLNSWYRRYPDGFFLIVKNGLRIGQLNLVPVEEEEFVSFRGGKVDLLELDENKFLSIDQARKAPILFVESLIIEGSITGKGLAAREVFRQLMEGRLNQVIDTGSLEWICALSASSPGDDLMVNGLNFTLEQPAHMRVDRHHFYAMPYDQLASHIQRYW